MTFSVIIPAYNASKTIHRCLDSVYALRVDESEFEVILVDDCSTDETALLAKEYANSHSNMIVLVQSENHRQGAARNRGLSVARGEMIVFLDSDDELDSGLVSALKLAEENELEMTVIRGVRIDTTGALQDCFSLPYPRSRVFSGIALQAEHPFWCTGPVLYIYLKAFLERVDYPFAEDVLYEDSDFVSVHLYNAKRMGYCDQCCYLIHSNPLSTTHTVSSRHICDYALLGTRMLCFYNHLENKEASFAKSILEGGSWNIMQSFKSLLKLSTESDVRSFYARFDRFADRRALLDYKKPRYCWTIWTRFCLKHKPLATRIIGLCLSIIGFLRNIKAQ